ncbi:Epsin-1 [Wickerhamiella sorbophila]|uniref:Epsin-1 n=1 Tax=Wickerhamiella sorbophila TaxID=45607 RepID=A0A2T0FLX1_9ASCO|nr:Epsin-1 [Wickerhamiella sorbophila]PRT55993.1 Epsin-1 [Wickerhamiella sorbophila]
MPFLRRLTKMYSGPTVLARHATSNEPYGPSPQDLHELAAVSRKPKLMEEVEDVLISRLQGSPKNWRQKSKALTVVQYLLLHGHDDCLIWLQKYTKLIETLTVFQYSDSKNVDQGKSVREKATAILKLLNDPDLIAYERALYLKNRQEVRTSTGRATMSRHTLELNRGLEDFDEQEEEQVQPSFDRSRYSLNLGLQSIAEEG